MKRNFKIRFRDSQRREATKNLEITSVIDTPLRRGEVDLVMVEFWDPNKDYHFLKPLEEELQDLESRIKSGDSDIQELKSRLGYWKKYSNKRNLITLERFWEDFDVDECTYLDRVGVGPHKIVCWDGDLDWGGDQSQHGKRRVKLIAGSCEYPGPIFY
jgi:hypothetical protein